MKKRDRLNFIELFIINFFSSLKCYYLRNKKKSLFKKIKSFYVRNLIRLCCKTETIKFQTLSNQVEKDPDVNVECEDSDSKVLHDSYIVTCSHTGYS